MQYPLAMSTIKERKKPPTLRRMLVNAANVYAHLDYNSKISSAAALAGGLRLE